MKRKKKVFFIHGGKSRNCPEKASLKHLLDKDVKFAFNCSKN